MEALTTDRIPSREEIDRYGEEAEKIYEPLREKLEEEHWGDYITIYPVNGDYAVGKTHLEAFDKLQKKYPGIAFYTIRIGYQAAVHFGGTGLLDGKRPGGEKYAQRYN